MGTESEQKKLSKKQKKLLEHKNKLKKNPGEIEVAKETAKVTKTAVKQQKKSRKILFVGNLSYKTSEEQIKEHFKACGEPIDVRLRKGFAFLEFSGDDTVRRLNVALRLHHTSLDGRKINVELTAGGGGNSKKRQAKLEDKRQKLDEERAERAKQEAVERAAKNKAGSGEPKREEKQKEAGAGPAIHPSRASRVR